MINLITCRSCDNCERFEEAITDPEGEIEVCPSVMCKLKGELFMNDSPPEECPYTVNHLVTCQNIPQSFADHCSGFD